MSSSYNCECELRKIAEELQAQAGELETAAETLRILRDSDEAEKQIESAKKWAKDWMKK